MYCKSKSTIFTPCKCIVIPVKYILGSLPVCLFSSKNHLTAFSYLEFSVLEIFPALGKDFKSVQGMMAAGSLPGWNDGCWFSTWVE